MILFDAAVSFRDFQDILVGPLIESLVEGITIQYSGEKDLVAVGNIVVDTSHMYKDGSTNFLLV